MAEISTECPKNLIVVSGIDFEKQLGETENLLNYLFYFSDFHQLDRSHLFMPSYLGREPERLENLFKVQERTEGSYSYFSSSLIGLNIFNLWSPSRTNSRDARYLRALQHTKNENFLDVDLFFPTDVRTENGSGVQFNYFGGKGGKEDFEEVIK